ncbi:MAG TPA: diacylglycerol kinase family protein [Gaiellaceae bacterium]|nr:diacylglycerol kinase family protein [Gaiellaceae bacterium]
MGRRILLVWNPASTEVTAESTGSVLAQLAERLEVVAMHTLDAGDGVRLGRLAADEGFDAVFVLGGDGTANEVVNGADGRVPIGVLPAGGTSVLPRVLGLPRDLDEAVVRLCDALDEGSERSISLGKLNDRCFTFAAGIGVDAEIVKRIDERGRGGDSADDSSRPGDLWFVREAIGVLLAGDYAEAMIHVEVPGKPDIHAATLFVANCSPWSFAGPVPLDVAPDASFEGGFDLVAVDAIELRSAPGRLASLLHRKDNAEDEGVERLHNLKQATVRCDRPLPVQVDGELIGELDSLELSVVPNAARLLI